MTWYQLEPCDAWFFRDGRPMNRGEHSNAVESQFPPQPTTVVGALRAAMARAQGWDGKSKWSSELTAVLGDGYEDLGDLSFTGPFIGYKGDPLFNCPRHLLGISSDGGVFEPRGFLTVSDEPVSTDLGVVHLPLPPKRTPEQERLEPGDGIYLTAQGIQAVLRGVLPRAQDCFHSRDLFELEARVGISLDEQTRTAQEGALFNPRYVRLKKDVSLLVGLIGAPSDWTLPAVFPFGGESRLAQATEIAEPDFPCSEAGDLVVLLSTAYFSENEWFGAGPGGSAEELGLLQGKVLTCAVDRPERVFGWDSLKGSPLPSLPVARPGTTWWLDSLQEGKTLVHLGRRNAHGYGLAVIGKRPK